MIKIKKTDKTFWTPCIYTHILDLIDLITGLTTNYFLLVMPEILGKTWFP